MSVSENERAQLPETHTVIHKETKEQCRDEQNFAVKFLTAIHPFAVVYPKHVLLKLET